MKNYICKNWPLAISLIIFGFLIFYLLIQSLNQNQGHLIYTLDDCYIHMAIAKNFAQYGIWGVTKYGFTSSSSSLLWTLLISVIYFIFGVNEITPFILNSIFAIGTLSIVYIIMDEFKISKFYTLIILLLIIALTPFPILIFTGMEHILHIFLIILFIYLSASTIVHDKDNFLKYLLILGFLLMMTRYESFFLIFIVSILFILKKKYLYSILLIAISLIPLGVYGLISTVNGWFFLPNSLVLKSVLTSNEPFLSKMYISHIFNHFINQVLGTEIKILIVLSFIFLLINLINRKFKDLCTIMIVIFISMALLHLFFADIGWFYRYEAYLIFVGIFVNSIVSISIFQKNKINFEKDKILRYSALILLLGLIVIPVASRGLYSFNEAPLATHNIYEQQYQIGLFVKQFYNDESVALNDIGAVNYLADIKCMDFYGLSDIGVAKARKGGYYTSEEKSNLIKKNNVKLIIIYESWFKNIPPDWIKVSDWEIRNNIVCGDNRVSFYVVSPKEKDNLIKNIRIFSSKLPSDIKVKIYS